MCKIFTLYKESITYTFLVIDALLALYFLILPSSHMFNHVYDSQKNITKFIDESVSYLNNTETGIDISQLNYEDIIELNPDSNLTVYELISKASSEMSQDIKSKWKTFKYCFIFTFVAMIINLFFDIIIFILSKWGIIDWPDWISYLCCCCCHIYNYILKLVIKAWKNCSNLFIQFLFFFISIILISFDIFYQNDEIKSSVEKFFDFINYNNYEENFNFFDDLDKYKNYIFIYFIILCIFEVLSFIFIIFHCCKFGCCKKRKEDSDSNKDVVISTYNNNYNNNNKN